MPTVEEELKKLKRDIEGLLESNRLDWLALAEKSMSREDRVSIRKSIAGRNVELADLIDRQWAIIGGR